MRQNLIDFGQFNINWLIGDTKIMNAMQNVAPVKPFAESIVSFLSDVSKALLADRDAKIYSDVMTFAFWIRRASVEHLKTRFADDNFRLGRGIVFHIAPSNVAVNYAYSLAAGLMCGNANVVRIPSKQFPQVDIINSAILQALEKHGEFKPYLALVRYGHDQQINDAFSGVADVRVIWGGDNTINELRKSPLQPRATEIAFADRYSLAVIDAEAYLNVDNKKKIANDFYNDTYLTDQNACTSPRVVVWTGNGIEEAKKQFWNNLHDFLVDKYELQGVQSVNKLTSAYLVAADRVGVQKIAGDDNLIVRIAVKSLDGRLMDLKDNSGYFFEYDCKEITELKDLCDDVRCQTISYIGSKEIFIPLIKSGIKGVDRIVPIGKTMDFDLIWDGYNLVDSLSRIVDFKQH